MNLNATPICSQGYIRQITRAIALATLMSLSVSANAGLGDLLGGIVDGAINSIAGGLNPDSPSPPQKDRYEGVIDKNNLKVLNADQVLLGSAKAKLVIVKSANVDAQLKAYQKQVDRFNKNISKYASTPDTFLAEYKTVMPGEVMIENAVNLLKTRFVSVSYANNVQEAFSQGANYVALLDIRLEFTDLSSKTEPGPLTERNVADLSTIFINNKFEATPDIVVKNTSQDTYQPVKPDVNIRNSLEILKKTRQKTLQEYEQKLSKVTMLEAYVPPVANNSTPKNSVSGENGINNGSVDGGFTSLKKTNKSGAANATTDKSFQKSLSKMNAGQLFAKADELSAQGDTTKARETLRALVSRFPNHALAASAAQQMAAMSDNDASSSAKASGGQTSAPNNTATGNTTTITAASQTFSDPAYGKTIALGDVCSGNGQAVINAIFARYDRFKDSKIQGILRDAKTFTLKQNVSEMINRGGSRQGAIDGVSGEVKNNISQMETSADAYCKTSAGCDNYRSLGWPDKMASDTAQAGSTRGELASVYIVASLQHDLNSTTLRALQCSER